MEDENSRQTLIYERALVQIRMLVTLTPPMPLDTLHAAIMAVLDTTGVTERMVRHYRDRGQAHT